MRKRIFQIGDVEVIVVLVLFPTVGLVGRIRLIRRQRCVTHVVYIDRLLKMNAIDNKPQFDRYLR